MNKFFKRLSILWLLFISLIFIGFAQEESENKWTQFRGEDRSGKSMESLEGVDWLTCSPKLVWKKELGSGFAELTILNDKMYTMTSETIDSITGSEFLAGYELKTGVELWRQRIDSIYFDPDGWGDGSRTTPSIDGDHIYCLSGHGKLSAHQIEDGDIIWQIDLKAKYGSTEPRWGFSTSPIILQDLLIMEVGGTEDKTFVAFDKENGKVVWNYGNGNASFNSPLLTTIDNQLQIIFANGKTLYSFNPKGDTLWTYAMPFGGITAMPLLVENNKIFLSGIRNPGFVIVEINDNKASEFIRGTSMKTDFNTAIYHDGYIYGFHVASLRCISAETGEVKWTKRGFGKGSLMMVDDILLVLSDKGKLIIVEAKPDAYEELKSVQALEGKSWTAPSFVNGKVYVRNLTHMACYKIK